MRIINVQIKAATVYIKNLSDSKSLSPEDVDAVLSAFEQVAYVARRLLLAACCSPLVARRLLHAACCTPLVARRWLHAACCTPLVARRLLRADACCKLSVFEQGGTSPTLHGSAE
jgi:hypothetical protein